MFLRSSIIALIAAFYASFAAAQDSRYPPPGFGKSQDFATSTGSPENKTPPGDAITPRAPIDGYTSPPATSTGSSPFKNSAPNSSVTPKILPLNNGETQPIRGTNQQPETPAAYDYTTPANNGGASQSGTGLTPSAMMRAMLTPPQGSQLRGQRVTLMEVIGGARNRAEQTERVNAYWDLCSSVADYYLGLREQDELRKLHSYAQQAGPAWSQAESELGVRVGTSQRAALAAQLRVASLMGRGLGNLPLPADTPHCANYITHYEQIFQGGGPAEAHELAGLLPLRFTELQDAATAVSRSEQYLDTVASRGGDGTDSLSALRLLALQRRAFVQIARDYNDRIARYADLASPGQLSAGRLTGMLINTGATATATKAASPAPPPRRQSNNAASPPPPTFAAGSPPAVVPNTDSATRDEAVKPASAIESTAAHSPPRQERSLLVPTSRSSVDYP